MSILFFFFYDTATTEIYTYLHTLSLHDALPIFEQGAEPLHLPGMAFDIFRIAAQDEILLVATHHQHAGLQFGALDTLQTPLDGVDGGSHGTLEAGGRIEAKLLVDRDEFVEPLAIARKTGRKAVEIGRPTASCLLPQAPADPAGCPQGPAPP